MSLATPSLVRQTSLTQLASSRSHSGELNSCDMVNCISVSGMSIERNTKCIHKSKIVYVVCTYIRTFTHKYVHTYKLCMEQSNYIHINYYRQNKFTVYVHCITTVKCSGNTHVLLYPQRQHCVMYTDV